MIQPIKEINSFSLEVSKLRAKLLAQIQNYWSNCGDDSPIDATSSTREGTCVGINDDINNENVIVQISSDGILACNGEDYNDYEYNVLSIDDLSSIADMINEHVIELNKTYERCEN